MPIPKEFYYKVTQSNIQYGYYPKGTIDVNRLLQGKKYWRAESLSEKTKQKKLIVTHWHALCWTDKTVEQVIQHLSTLLEDGFELYLWQKGGLLTLNKDNLSSLRDINIRKQMVLEFQEAVAKACAVKGIARDQMLVFDNYWIDKALENNDSLGERTVKLSELARVTMYMSQQQREEYITKLISIILQYPPPLALFIDDRLKPRTKELSDFLKEKFPQIPITYVFTEIILDEKQLEILLKKGTIPYEESVLTLADLKSCTSLTLRNCVITQENSSLLLSKTPKLKELVLISCTITDPLEIPLGSLKDLLLFRTSDQTKISYENLAQMILAAPKLEQISLRRSVLIPPINNIYTLPVAPELNTIDFTQTPINDTILRNLIHKGNRISTLLLSASNTLVSELELSLDTLDLSQLESLLVIPLPPLNSAVINKIIDNTPKLTGLCRIEGLTEKASMEDVYKLFESLGKFPQEVITKIRAINNKVNTQTLLGKEKHDEYTKPVEIQIDPTHDFTSMKEFKPTPEANPFIYTGTKKTKNQGMVIEQLSQYLTLTKQNLAYIPKMQDGICCALAHGFKETPEQWNSLLDALVLWNGQADTLTPELTRHFNTLILLVKKFYMEGNVADETAYLGEQLVPLLSQVPLNSSVLLSNPWHEIAVQRVSTGWRVYDPNFVHGPRIVAPGELESTLHTAIGRLIGVRKGSIPGVMPQISISNPSDFIEQGGLFILCRSSNAAELISFLPPEHPYTKEGLDGLLLRDVKGIPAWVRGLRSSLCVNLTKNLLRQFQEKNKQDWEYQLQKSIECLSGLEKMELIQYLVPKAQVENIQKPQSSTVIKTQKPLKENQESEIQSIEAVSKPTKSVPIKSVTIKSLEESLIAVVSNKDFFAPIYERLLQTWDTKTKTQPTPKAYAQACVSDSLIKKRLIQLSSTEEVLAMQEVLYEYAKNTHRPVYTINTPEDLICSASFIALQTDGTGTINEGPGGPLRDFLICHKDDAPILIVNYDNFSAQDLVRFNALLDEKRYADGTPLPEKALVIGMINLKKPDCYQGSDFYSRFDKIERNPMPSEQLVQSLTKRTIEEYIPGDQDDLNEDQKPYIIQLYHAADWEERLLGRWVLKGKDLVFQEGELQSALNSKRPICIANGLWENESFQAFWREAYLSGSVAHGRILFPKETQITRQEGYAKSAGEVFCIKTEKLSPPDALVLNPGLLHRFFGTYTYKKEQLYFEQGYIEAAANQGKKALDVTLTRPLHPEEQMQLLDQCKKYGVVITLHTPPGVSDYSNFKPKPWDKALGVGPTEVIISSDIDTSLLQITQHNNTSVPWTIIDISETEVSDLLHSITGTLEGKPPHFLFSERDSFLLTELKLGKKIILKGHFSQELIDALAPVLLERQKDPKVKGQLILVSEETPLLGFMPKEHCRSHQVSAAEKRLALPLAKYTELAPFIEKESLAKLQARAAYQGAGSSEEHWIGLKSLPLDLQPPVDFSTDPKTSKAEAEAFFQQRRNAIDQALKNQPYVFLAGLSGVGKSTYVENEFCREDEHLFLGESQIESWANCDTAGTKYLFIDEANIGDRQWTEFEGLYNIPPTLFIDGKLYPLTEKHKVIFAGNPANYSDERQLPSLFARHGNTVVFSPLTQNVVFERILKPVFAKKGVDKLAKTQAKNSKIQDADIEKISRHILKAYQFLCACSTTDVLISPRELQMIALLVCSHLRNDSNADPMALTQAFTFEIIAPLVPEEHKEQFIRDFTPQTPFIFSDDSDAPGFKLTQSRLPIKHMIDARLALSELRHTETQENVAQLYGGLGGIILEGEPGIGKSELVIEVLRSRGYKECSQNTHASETRIFYRMPVSMSVGEKQELLVKAFHQGAVVVIDEINSSPMMERLLNDLLMGKGPDGKPPKCPGFMIIGTQNPMSMAGRRAISTALARRLTTVAVSNYTTEEIEEILVAKNLTPKQAHELAITYARQVAYAEKEHLSPVPTFRDLLRAAGWLTKEKTQCIQNCFELLNEICTRSECLSGEDIADNEAFKRKQEPLLFAATEESELKLIEKALVERLLFIKEHQKTYKDCEAFIAKINEYSWGGSRGDKKAGEYFSIRIKNAQNYAEIQNIYEEIKDVETHWEQSSSISRVITEIIDNFKQGKNPGFFFTSMNGSKKAEAIEQALNKIPPHLRYTIPEGKTPESKAVLKALASHRHFWRLDKTTDANDNVLKDHAARSYSDFFKKIEKMTAKTEPSKNAGPKAT